MVFHWLNTHIDVKNRFHFAVKLFLVSILALPYGCANKMEKKERLDHTDIPSAMKEDTLEILDVSVKQLDVIADHFDFPVGKPEGIGYYNAQSFGENDHLGDDWNGTGGGNTDLGDAIYAIANGKVTFAEDIGGGWGNVIRIYHVLEDGRKVESLYAHCDTILVATSDTVSIGQKIGTIGTAHGLYYAHLHFEIRENINMPIGGGYSQNTTGYVDPTEFIRTHR